MVMYLLWQMTRMVSVGVQMVPYGDNVCLIFLYIGKFVTLHFVDSLPYKCTNCICHKYKNN